MRWSVTSKSAESILGTLGQEPGAEDVKLEILIDQFPIGPSSPVTHTSASGSSKSPSGNTQVSKTYPRGGWLRILMNAIIINMHHMSSKVFADSVD